MEAQAIANALATKQPGQFFSYNMERDAKIRKNSTTDKITRASQGIGQFCEYSRRASVANAVADGLRDAPELPSHIAESFYVDNVRFWRNHNGQVYLPVCVAQRQPTKTQWYRNGKPVEKSEIQEYLLASENTKPPTKESVEEKGQALFIAIKIENILEIH